MKIVHCGADVATRKAGRFWDDGAGHRIAGTDLVLEDVILVSNPPPGGCRILNVYWDPQTQKAVFEYEDTPEP